jgi:putative redox protein
MHPIRPVTVETHQGQWQQRVTVGPHDLRADELVEDGGDDGGPSPFEYLAASLGACTTMTVKSYADLKGLSLRSVRVVVHVTREADRLHLVRELHLEGELTDEQRQRMVDISKRCPVHKALSGTIAIETTVV